jgi:hypothetical protein
MAVWLAADMKTPKFVILTNLIHQEWSGVSVRSHKDLKDLHPPNLRDHMSEAGVTILGVRYKLLFGRGEHRASTK